MTTPSDSAAAPHQRSFELSLSLRLWAVTILTECGVTQVLSCPADMVEVEDMYGDAVCMDMYEAPNTPLYRPLVMYDYDEAQAWCAHRSKRLCYEDEWTNGCAGPSGDAYPYGNTHVPGMCNDNQPWLLYNQTILNYYQDGWSTPEVESVEELMWSIQRTHTPQSAILVDHLEWLYQGRHRVLSFIDYLTLPDWIQAIMLHRRNLMAASVHMERWIHKETLRNGPPVVSQEGIFSMEI
jgi:hypothetical protein